MVLWWKGAGCEGDGRRVANVSFFSSASLLFLFPCRPCRTVPFLNHIPVWGNVIATRLARGGCIHPPFPPPFLTGMRLLTPGTTPPCGGARLCRRRAPPSPSRFPFRLCLHTYAFCPSREAAVPPLPPPPRAGRRRPTNPFKETRSSRHWLLAASLVDVEDAGDAWLPR